MPDFKLPSVDKQHIFNDEEERIKVIVKNKIINNAGSLIKIGVIVAKCCMALKAEKCIKEIEKKD